jgi:class 3 adenylate cyclase
MNEHAQGEGSGPRATPEVSVPLSDTITIFFSDIRGFTDTTEELGDEVANELVREQDAIVRSHIEAYGGDVVKTQGDGFMVAFKATRGAILCAIAIQRSVAQKNRNQSGPRIAIGIGINTGEPIRQEDGDYIGGTVNLASRICAAAGPGQILVAESTRHVAGRIELRRSDGGVVEYLDRGLQPLKGFPEPKRLFEVTWHPAAFGDQPPPEPTPSADESEIAAVKVAVLRAINVLTRVLGISHMDDPAFPSLLECQAKASELRVAFSRAGSDGRGLTADRILENIKPFEDLLTLMLERDTLTDERWAQLDTAVARVFGRTLVNVAARGRLTITLAGKPAPPVAPPPPEPVMERPKEPEAAPTPVPVVPAPRSSVAAALAPPPLDERAIVVRWWAAGYAAWSQWKPSGLAWAHALRAEIGRFPYLLSVHIRTAADHDDGQLAGGYFLLLEHVENESPGFMRTVFDRAVADVGVDSGSLDRRLYELLVDDGRLRETYASFVRDVIQVAVPTPGMWADAGIVEHDDSTTLMSRPTRGVGDAQEESVRLIDPHERGAERRFRVSLEAMTTRFFYVKSGKLKTPRDVDVRLTSEGAPSDRGWYLSVRDSLSGRSDPKLIPTAGATIPNLGRDNFGVWIAVFNPNPVEVVTYELTMTVRQPRQQSAARSVFARPGGPAR